MKKNILIFGHGYAPQFIDISNQYTHLFDKNNYEVTVAYLSGPENQEVKRKHAAENVIFLNSPKKSVRGLKCDAIKRLYQLCREKKFDRVICHRYKPSYIMMIIARFCKINALFFVMHELGTLSGLFRKISVALLWQKNMIFAGVSTAVRDDIRRTIWRVPDQYVITLHNMIDVMHTQTNLLTKEAARQYLNIPQQAFVFGTIGRLVKNKDQKSLIEAFALIQSHCPEAKLVIAGEGELEQALKTQANRLGLKDYVIFTGFVPDAFRYLNAFDVFVLPSIQEAFGRVLLEAMVAKKVIIAAKTHGIPEVMGETGILVPAENPAELSSAMLKIYNARASQRTEIGNKAYDRVVSQFSFQRFQEIFWEHL